MELKNWTLDAAVLPTVTVAPDAKLVPSIVTALPGLTVLGETADTVGEEFEGAEVYVNPFARLPDCPSAFCTTTLTAAAVETDGAVA
ncbi:MAG TPA: hypothetical protein VNJ52_11170 [Patescibacteria group bacterium]|nr:hypothetical protein [Patescibacteria group bacterium]